MLSLLVKEKPPDFGLNRPVEHTAEPMDGLPRQGNELSASGIPCFRTEPDSATVMHVDHSRPLV